MNPREEQLSKVELGYLDGNIAIQAFVARTVHFAHAARADQRKDLVGPQ
jgi:hypothetical protein